MEKLSVNKRDMIALAVLIVFGSLAAETIFCVLANRPEVFREISSLGWRLVMRETNASKLYSVSSCWQESV